ncbi:EAL domain-containing protein [Cereibacter sphaeroides]|nr:EAL domain-containing protein [Cereibacter sphaeroides]
MIRSGAPVRERLRKVREAILRAVTLQPSPEDAASVVGGTAAGASVTAVNAVVYAAATVGADNALFTTLWLSVVFALCMVFVRMSSRAAGRKITRVSRRAARRLVLTSILLAAPWAALPIHVVAFHGAGDEMLVLLVCTGMLSGGAFMLHRAFVASLAYVWTILLAVIFSFQFGGWAAAWPVTAYAIVYGSYLAYFTYTAGRTARQRDELVAALSDAVQSLQQARDENHRLANIDFATGLLNRKAFHEALQASVAHEALSREPFGLLLLDLDRFKTVNDLYGHGVGDKLLAELAQRLRGALARRDIIGRVGGDEFAVILRDVADAETTAAVSGRLLKELNRPVRLGGPIIRSGASIGAALCPGDGRDPADLMLKADLALNRAKEEGRGRAMQFDIHLQRRAAEVDGIEAGLRAGLDARTFRVLYQPQFSLCDGGIVGAEALVRWPEDGPDAPSPERFLGVASERGLLPALSRLIAETVAEDIGRWRGQGVRAPKIALNLHPDDVKSPETLLETIDMFETRGITGQHLTLEITEECLVGRGTDGAAEVLERLVGRGFGLSFDDFGTGHASLSHLKKVPVTEIKIDRQFVAGLAERRDDRAIVAAIAEIARGMGLRSIAEGVETEIQRRILTELGIEAGQGFLWSVPVCSGRLAGMLGGAGR